jgi:multicomponent Na+:H+ antiporter subunit G
MREALTLLFLWLGTFLLFAGSLGIARIPGFYDRIQTAYTCFTGGAVALFFSAILFFGISAGGAKALIAAGLAVICLPTAANALAGAAWKHERSSGVKKE